MDKYLERHEENVIDLGTASVETKGSGSQTIDVGGLQNPAGITDED